jgi:hypothetical protein
MALILICSAAVVSDVSECTAKNARAVMRVPAEFGNPITHFMHAVKRRPESTPLRHEELTPSWLPR